MLMTITSLQPYAACLIKAGLLIDGEAMITDEIELFSCSTPAGYLSGAAFIAQWA